MYAAPREEDRPRHVVAVNGFVIDGAGRVLLVRPHDRGWEMPGGCVELGENLVEALQREIEEETGCRVHVDGLIGVHSRVSASEMVVLHFRCRHESGGPRPSPETPEVGWFGIEEAGRLVETQPNRDRLRDALAPERGLVYRVYWEQPSYQIVSEQAV
jgi:ADP-ribose pyrophosphatase YjhB (NUDIX family)